MNAGRIGEIQPPLPLDKPGASGVSGAPQGGPSFGEALEDALRSVDSQMQNADKSAASWVAGDGGDLHTVLLTMEKADMSFRTMVQVRNKLLEAYQEIMRIQV